MLKLYPFQEKAVEKFKNVDKCAFFFDMGLGKTITSLYWTQKKVYKNVLVFCQATKQDDWVEELNNFFNTDTHKILKDTDKLSKYNVISYNKVSLKQYQEFLEKNLSPDTLLIFDESQNVKGFIKVSKRAKWAMKITKNIKNILLLSGTPKSNGYWDFFPQVNIMGMTITKKLFGEKFIEFKKLKMQGYSIPIPDYSKNDEEFLTWIKTKSIFYKTEDVHSLPQQNFQTIWVEDKKSNKLAREIQKHGILEFNEKELVFDNSSAKFMATRQLSSGFMKETRIHDKLNPKQEALKDVLDSLKEQGSSMVIFYTFKYEKVLIKEVLKELDIKGYYLDGSEKTWTMRKGFNALLVQYQAGSSGINLQDYNYMVYFGLTLSSADYEQSKKRIHRIGQNKPCFYYNIIVKGSLEERVNNNLGKFRDYTEKMFKNDYEKEG